MKNKHLTASDIKTVENFVLEELKNDYSDQNSSNLNMPGLETILILIASKVVIPIVVSIVGRIGYDKIDEWRKGKLDKEELIEQTSNFPIQGLSIPKNIVIADIVKDLQSEGISQKKAEELAEKAFDKFRPFYKE